MWKVVYAAHLCVLPTIWSVNEMILGKGFNDGIKFVLKASPQILHIKVSLLITSRTPWKMEKIETPRYIMLLWTYIASMWCFVCIYSSDMEEMQRRSLQGPQAVPPHEYQVITWALGADGLDRAHVQLHFDHNFTPVKFHDCINTNVGLGEQSVGRVNPPYFQPFSDRARLNLHVDLNHAPVKSVTVSLHGCDAIALTKIWPLTGK